MGRNTQGVRLIALAKNEVLVGIERILEDKEEVVADSEESQDDDAGPPNE
jgi:hypothetical protein